MEAGVELLDIVTLPPRDKLARPSLRVGRLSMLCYGKMKDLNVREAGSRLSDLFAVELHSGDRQRAPLLNPRSLERSGDRPDGNLPDLESFSKPIHPMAFVHIQMLKGTSASRPVALVVASKDS